MMLPKSIRHRIILFLCCTMLLVLGCTGLISYQFALHEVDEVFSARLATTARILKGLIVDRLEEATINQPIVIPIPDSIKANSDHLIQNEDINLLSNGHPYETKIAFQIWHDDGRLLIRSESAPINRLGQLRQGFQEYEIQNVNWHLFSMKSQHLWIVVAENVEIRNEMAQEIAYTLIAPLAIGIIILIFVSSVLIQIGLKPIQNLAKMITNRDPKTHTSIPNIAPKTELEPVINALNEWIKRVEAAFHRERRFIDDAAHEIRTPLAALKVHIENAVRHECQSSTNESLQDALEGINKISHLTQQMLNHGRLTAGLYNEPISRINVSEFFNSIIYQNFFDKIDDLDSVQDEGLFINAKPWQLEILIRNLVDNALKHRKPVHSKVHISLTCITTSPVQKTIQLSIENQSEIHSTETMNRIFDAYFRDVSSGSSGSGLGLAMVYEIAKQHGWQLHATQDLNLSRFKITCLMPLLVE